MKLAIFFVRRSARRTPAHPAHLDMVTTWTTREWADMPTHRPRRRD